MQEKAASESILNANPARLVISRLTFGLLIHLIFPYLDPCSDHLLKQEEKTGQPKKCPHTQGCLAHLSQHDVEREAAGNNHSAKREHPAPPFHCFSQRPTGHSS